MSQCSDCYNGCVQVTSDRCVMYTGIDVPLLGIKKGDSLSYVEQAIITFLGSVLDGSGIKITLSESDYCTLVSQYLLECEEVTALDLFRALVKAACDLQEQVNTEKARIDVIEANYTVGCLDGVSAGDGTHDILQAVITKLCEIDTSLAALAVDVETNYVKIADLNDYIAAYIASTTGATRYSSRMVPYCPIPYIGSLSNFDGTGAGIVGTEWEDIYLCNGSNGTPDMRGRVPVGAIDGVPGGGLSSVVNPASDPTFNPNYAVGDVDGSNKTTLTTSQIPSHTHVVNDPGHTHILASDEDIDGNSLAPDDYLANESTTGTEYNDYLLQGAVAQDPTTGKVLENTTGITLDNTGSGEAHSNIQPVLATYFIIYIPA